MKNISRIYICAFKKIDLNLVIIEGEDSLLRNVTFPNGELITMNLLMHIGSIIKVNLFPLLKLDFKIQPLSDLIKKVPLFSYF